MESDTSQRGHLALLHTHIQINILRELINHLTSFNKSVINISG